MQFEGARRGARIPNLTPLIDIVFLLLVFFLLTAHFVKDETLPVDLPEAVSGEAGDTKELLEIVLDGENHLFVDGRAVAAEKLAPTIRKALTDRASKQVRLRGDRHAEMARVVMVMDAARRAGASGLDIVTQRP